MKNRGMSAIIATLLLIALALILAVIIYTWSVNEIVAFGSPLAPFCEKTSISAEIIPAQQGYTLAVINRENIPLTGLTLSKSTKGDVQFCESDLFPQALQPGADATIKVPLNCITSDDLNNPDVGFFIIPKITVDGLKGKVTQDCPAVYAKKLTQDPNNPGHWVFCKAAKENPNDNCGNYDPTVQIKGAGSNDINDLQHGGG